MSRHLVLVQMQLRPSNHIPTIYTGTQMNRSENFEVLCLMSTVWILIKLYVAMAQKN